MPCGLLVHLPIKYTANYGIFSNIRKLFIDYFLKKAKKTAFFVFLCVFSMYFAPF